jgi:hypothetical protein
MDIKIGPYKGIGGHCFGDNCKKLPECIEYVCLFPNYDQMKKRWSEDKKEFCIKRGSICAIVSFRGGTEFYCRDCIPELYQKLKASLDTNLWAFH